MKIIISPAKTMQIAENYLGELTTPVFAEKADLLIKRLKSLNKKELKAVLNCSDKLVELNYDRFTKMNDSRGVSPALLSYIGIQFQNISANVLNISEWDYINKNLFILSGLYGVLRASDAIKPYRLEMQAKLDIDSFDNLYDFWCDDIYREVMKNDNIIINLASKEYSKTISKYLSENVKFYDIVFAEIISGKIKVKATPAKIARGNMLRYMAQNKINDIESLKKFNLNNYVFEPELSEEYQLVFVQK